MAEVLVEQLEALAHELSHQRLLVGEVPVDGADADTGVTGDVVHLDVGLIAGEQLACRLDDALAVAAGVGAQRALGVDWRDGHSVFTDSLDKRNHSSL